MIKFDSFLWHEPRWASFEWDMQSWLLSKASEQNEQFCGILQFIFIPSKVNKKEKRERVKIKKKLAFQSVYRRTSLALFSLLVNISNQDASSGRVSYFTFFFDIGFLFFSLWLSLLLCFGQQRWTPYRGRKGKVNDDTRAGVSSILRMRRKSYFLFLKSCSFFVI